MTKLLITGATGLLGSNLVRHGATQSHEVIGVSHVPTKAPAGVTQRVFDLTNRDMTFRHLNDVQPEAIIHCAAMTNVDRCEREPAGARWLNVEATKTVAQWAMHNDARFVFISTDSIFDGSVGHYRENDAPHPVNEYARTKLAAEEVARSLIPEALIIRTNFYGWNWKDDKSSVGEWMLGKLLRRESFAAFADVRFGPLFTADLSGIILELLARKASGSFHIAARNECSKYEFANSLAEMFQLDSRSVTPISVDDFPFGARRPKNTSLVVEKITSFLGREMPSVEEGLRSFKRLLGEEHLSALKNARVARVATAGAV
ncbi:MAG: SDR family oxidoreductase [Candidatus Acidiferrales bacterium]